MSRPDVTPPVTLATPPVTAGDPLSPELLAVALKAGLGEDAVAHVWAKFCAFYEGKRVQMPKDWRLWCLREKRSHPPGRAGPLKAPVDTPDAIEGRNRAQKNAHEKLRRAAVPAPTREILAAVGLGKGGP